MDRIHHLTLHTAPAGFCPKKQEPGRSKGFCGFKRGGVLSAKCSYGHSRDCNSELDGSTKVRSVTREKRRQVPQTATWKNPPHVHTNRERRTHTSHLRLPETSCVMRCRIQIPGHTRSAQFISTRIQRHAQQRGLLETLACSY